MDSRRGNNRNKPIEHLDTPVIILGDGVLLRLATPLLSAVPNERQKKMRNLGGSLRMGSSGTSPKDPLVLLLFSKDERQCYI